MGERTTIAWTNSSWNPVTGCSRVSDGCRFCYAEALSLRMGWSAKPWSAANARENVILHPERLPLPRKWRDGRMIFVNSMSDLFHPLVPDAFIAEVFAVMAECPRHTFQILTKRPERAETWPGPWTSNIWMGTSVEDRRVLDRIDHIRGCGAQVRFLSCEPLIGPLGDIDLAGIHWVIVGGESGPTHRPMDHAWARDIRDQCVAAGVAFFFKQSSGRRPGTGEELIEADGSRAQWREFPQVAVTV